MTEILVVVEDSLDPHLPIAGPQMKMDEDDLDALSFIIIFFIFQSITIPHFHSFLAQLSHNISQISLTHPSNMLPGEDPNRAMERIMFALGDKILDGIRAIQEQEHDE